MDDLGKVLDLFNRGLRHEVVRAVEQIREARGDPLPEPARLAGLAASGRRDPRHLRAWLSEYLPEVLARRAPRT